MILLKEFIRYKSTKMFFVSFTTLLVALLILISFTNYYSKFATKIYQDNSYFLITSEKNIYNELNSHSDVDDLTEVVLLKPDTNSEFLNNENFGWDHLYDPSINFLISYAEDNFRGTDLNDNKVAFGLPSEVIKSFKNIKELNNKQVSFMTNYNTFEFECVEIFESNFSRILVNKKTFEELLLSSNEHSYISTLKNYDNISATIENLKKMDGVTSLEFIQSYQSDVSINTLGELKNIISILKYTCLIIAIIFFLLYIIVTKNIVTDELEKMHLERLIGYNKRQIKKFLTIKILFISICIEFLSSIIYLLLIYIINIIFKVNITPIGNSTLLYIFLIIIALSLIFCVFAKQKKH